MLFILGLSDVSVCLDAGYAFQASPLRHIWRQSHVPLSVMEFGSPIFKGSLADHAHALFLINIPFRIEQPLLPLSWTSFCPSGCKMIISNSKHSHSYQPPLAPPHPPPPCSASGIKAAFLMQFGKNRFPWCTHLDSVFVYSYGMFYIWQTTKIRYCRKTPDLSSKMLLYLTIRRQSNDAGEVFSSY